MDDLRNGDKVIIKGYCGEDRLIAKHWASKFAFTQIQSGDYIEIIDNSKEEICYSCHQTISSSRKEGSIFINLYRYKDEELVILNKEYDLIYQVDHNKSSFFPKLVGGKRY